MPVLTEDEMLNRVRSLLKCASRRGYAARSATPGSEIWKILFNQIDVDGSGALDFTEIKRMVRADLRLPERVVSDYELHKLFQAIDDNGNGTVDFAEFMEYTSQGKVDKRPLAVALRQIARVVRLALRRKRVKLSELEQFCYDFSEVDFMSGHGQMTPEEHSRFFRDHMLINARECSGSNLNQLFKTLCRPQDRAQKTVNASDFTDALRFMASTDDFGGTSPPRPHRGLIGGMSTSGYLPDIMSKPRPGGFLIQGPSSEPPFCFNGRDLPPNNRLSVNDRNFSVMGERSLGARRLKMSASEPALPPMNSCTFGGFSEIERRYARLAEAPSPGSDDEASLPPGNLRAETKTLRQDSKEHASDLNWATRKLTEALAECPDFQTTIRPESQGSQAFKGDAKSTGGKKELFNNFGLVAEQAEKPWPIVPSKGSNGKRKDSEECRGAYFCLNGAEALNRVEHRLFHAGLDVRGHFHKRHAEEARQSGTV